MPYFYLKFLPCPFRLVPHRANGTGRGGGYFNMIADALLTTLSQLTKIIEYNLTTRAVFAVMEMDRSNALSKANHVSLTEVIITYMSVIF